MLRATILREFEVVQEAVGGHQLWVRADPRERAWDLAMARPILEGDEYELLPIRGDGHDVRLVVDVGGHVGSFTLRAKSLWPHAAVIAVEPDPETAQVFRRNTAHLTGVHFYEAAAVAPGREVVRFCLTGRGYEGDGNTASSFVIDDPAGAKAAAHRLAPACVVRGRSLGSILDAHAIRQIDILKLDCEGSELEILQDLQHHGYLAKTRWVRGEWHHREHIPEIEALLRVSHTPHFDPTPHPQGVFIAHRTDLHREPG